MTPNRPHLVVDARGVAPDATGVGHYTAGMLGALDTVAPSRGWRVTAIRARAGAEGAPWPDSLWKSLANTETVPVEARSTDHPRGDWWLQTSLPKLVEKLHGDVLFSPAFVCPWGRRRFARILTVHDAIPWDLPQNYPVTFATWLRCVSGLSVRFADAVLTDSPSAARRLRANRVGGCTNFTVLPPGVDPAVYFLRETGESNALPGDFHPSGPLVVCPGSPEPRKNHEVIAEAIKLEPLRSLSPTVVLLRREETPGVERTAACLSFHPPTPKKMADWLRSAAVIATPSRMEGFGMSVLEGMASGTPVVASDIAPHRWMTRNGSAAILIPPDDVFGWAEALADSIRRDSSVTQRITRGIRQSRRFTWDTSANRLIGIADRLIRGV